MKCQGDTYQPMNFLNVKRRCMDMETKMFAEYDDVVTAEELQQMLKLGRSKTYSLLQNGEIKSRKVGSEYRIQKVNVIKYLEEV